ncbi:hypothetical protein G6O69_07825 [Pseudenhygromyxa sp. WMMC2535]|uniref:hypothetical protein n=1 Tax=Pseudenhygromyxa sp. WMMC2535 TaxID=2712867 RepID=UPI0015575E1E|nr:hypothetical protein [Pseudenhygromyxa sp. WMMC2535]NVB37738.1 hypothetical protein [Pseudenhygromyxa sp. WMMC2535]
MKPSSQDLHPKTGARFVFERAAEPSPAGEPRYALTIYLPAGREWSGELSWAEGHSLITDEPDASAVDEALGLALAEAHKLARVLRRDPKPKLVRWRAT